MIECIVGLLFLAAGILLCVFTYYYSKTMIEGANWISAPATITYTYSSEAYGSLSGSSGIEYVPHPVYTFVAADGKTYSGSQYSLSFDTERSPQVNEAMLQSPTVVDGSIYYDPKNPDDSAVIKPLFIPTFSFVFILMALVFIDCGIMLIKEVIKREEHSIYRHTHHHKHHPG